jgi:hypothetical protein
LPTPAAEDDEAAGAAAVEDVPGVAPAAVESGSESEHPAAEAG